MQSKIKIVKSRSSKLNGNSIYAFSKLTHRASVCSVLFSTSADHMQREGGSDATRLSPHLCARVFSVTLAKSLQQRVERLPSFRGGWRKWTYSSNAFCCCSRSLFWKSRSFVYWVRLIKIPFYVIRFDLPITQMCSWNESKHATVVQRCRPRLSLAMEETTRSHSHTKATVKSSNATPTRFVALRGKVSPHCVPNDAVS